MNEVPRLLEVSRGDDVDSESEFESESESRIGADVDGRRALVRPVTRESVSRVDAGIR